MGGPAATENNSGHAWPSWKKILGTTPTRTHVWEARPRWKRILGTHGRDGKEPWAQRPVEPRRVVHRFFLARMCGNAAARRRGVPSQRATAACRRLGVPPPRHDTVAARRRGRLGRGAPTGPTASPDAPGRRQSVRGGREKHVMDKMCPVLKENETSPPQMFATTKQYSKSRVVVTY